MAMTALYIHDNLVSGNYIVYYKYHAKVIKQNIMYQYVPTDHNKNTLR